MDDHEFGQLDDPVVGLRRLQVTGYYILVLFFASLASSILMALVGFPVPGLVLAWMPILAYLLMCAFWAIRHDGYYVGWNWPVDKIWSKYWLEDGYLEKNIGAALGRDMIPFVKTARWSYFIYFELPEGVGIGISRMYNGRRSDIIMVHVEGVNHLNVDIARDVHDVLDSLRLGHTPTIAKVVCSPTSLQCPSKG
jgi:hypothetical protein